METPILISMFDEVPPAGKFERACARVPILGWILASMFETQRFRSYTDRVDAILESRPPTEPTRWGDLYAQGVARKVCKLINDEIMWVDDHFIPEDQLRAVVFAHVDGLDDVEAFMDIKDAFKLDMNHNWWVDLMQSSMTMGEFVNWLRERSDHTLRAD